MQPQSGPAPDFEDAPSGAYIAATATGIALCPDCHVVLSPTIGLPAGDSSAVIINCRCAGKFWRFLFQSKLEVASTHSRLTLATVLPNGLPRTS